VISSHILSDIEQLCDKICILNYGELVEQGDLATLLRVADPPIVVKIAGDTEAFLTELESDGLTAEVFKDRLTIPNGDGVIDSVIEAAAASGVQLRHLSTGTRNLEELFVELLEKKEGRLFRRAGKKKLKGGAA
jgi:ABC-2 type transport system ATP-binding protein